MSSFSENEADGVSRAVGVGGCCVGAEEGCRGKNAEGERLQEAVEAGQDQTKRPIGAVTSVDSPCF